MTTIATTSLKLAANARDAALNLSCSRLAIVADDGTISVFSRGSRGELWCISSTWKANSAGLLKVAWAHPVWGTLLATADEGGHISVWRETLKNSNSTWQLEGGVTHHAATVTALSFAPHVLGLQLAAAFIDGHIRVYSMQVSRAGTNWQLISHTSASCGNASCLSWQPAVQPSSPLMLVGTSAGAQVWRHEASRGSWTPAATIQADGPISSVHWAPNLGQPKDMVAVASNSRVVLYSLAGPANALQVESMASLDHAAPVTSLQWNAWGTWLAVATEDCQVQQWRPNLAGEWTLQGRLVGTCGSEHADNRPATDMLLVD